MLYEMNNEEFEMIVKYANDELETIPGDVLSRFQNLSWAVQRKVMNRMKTLEAKSGRLQTKVDRLTRRETAEAAAGNFGETGLDSVEVAIMVVHYLQAKPGCRFSKSRVISILYEMYATWLHDKRQRLFLEHPAATEYGPQLWRVYKRLDLHGEVSREQFKEIAGKNPAVAAFARNAVEKYHDMSERILSDYFKKSDPYRNASADRNKGKWGTEISDADIFAWKDSAAK